MRILDGFFIFMGLFNLMKYSKPPLLYSEQLKLLESRGLLISNPQEAEQFLAKVNYYRFSAYCLPFEVQRHQFSAGVCFTDIANLYVFDRQLRQVIDNALEIIEIYLRAKITYVLTRHNGAFIHEEVLNFYDQERHQQWLSRIHEEIERSKETFVVHYKKTYEDFPKLPLWMAVEVMSFGALSKLFSNLNRKYQAEIGQEIGFHHSLLLSWIHSLNFVRNVCAHHARLWNREMAIALQLPKSIEWQTVHSKRVGSILYVLNTLLKTIPSAKLFHKQWQSGLEALLESSTHKDFILKGMAFSLENQLWSNKKDETVL